MNVNGGWHKVIKESFPTQREIQVLQCVADGNSRALIAKLLGISTHTVNAHINSARAKLGAKTTPHAISILKEKNCI
ncbi:MAG: LuxR family transcriptional regulator [Caulobacteraceae bacterium]|nr:LuxR family transcriptional regulator [Caulobacteraceae bacterium]